MLVNSVRVATLLLLLLITGCGLTTSDDRDPLKAGADPTIPPLPTLDPNSIDQGRVVYASHCAGCHGANLEGEPDWSRPNEDGSFRAPPHDATGHTWHHSDSLIHEAIQKGGSRYPADLGVSSPMPAFESVLTETEIEAVIIYIKSQWPDDARQTQWQVTTLECQAAP